MSRPTTSPATLDGLWNATEALEGHVRAAQHGLPSSAKGDRLQRSGRTDLMPGRHLAIALTDLESARLRIGEAQRLLEEGETTP